LLIYRIRASHIGLVQLQDKIVVRFALTIYPYSLYCFEKIGVSSFYLPSPYRYNAAERLCRIEELAFVTKNLGYFYDKFIPIFEAALGKNHSLVTQLKNKPNLKSNYLKYDPRKEPLIEKYEN